MQEVLQSWLRSRAIRTWARMMTSMRLQRAGVRRLADGIFTISGSGGNGQRVVADETDEDTDTETDYGELEEVAKRKLSGDNSTNLGCQETMISME